MKPFGTDYAINDYLQQRRNVRNKIRGTIIKHKVRGSVKGIAKKSFRGKNDKLDVLLQASNTIDIPEELIERLEEQIHTNTLELSTIILEEGTSLIMAYKYAVEYSAVVLRDGLGVDPGSVDNDVEEVMANIIKIRVLEFLLSNVKVGDKYKDILMTRLAISMAKKNDKNYVLTDTNPDNIVGVMRKKK